jgi:hypothetical protein
MLEKPLFSLRPLLAGKGGRGWHLPVRETILHFDVA